MKNFRPIKSRERILQEVQAALVNLRIACEQWELGRYEQSITIATILRVLLYDYLKKSKSLLGQLNWKAQSFFTTPAMGRARNQKGPRSLAYRISTAWIEPDSQVSKPRDRWTPKYFSPDAVTPVDGSSSIIKQTLPFIEWWKEVVLWNQTYTMSREELVLALSNELGGTHAAPTIKPRTVALLAGELTCDTLPWQITIGGLEMRCENAPYDAVIRQIAFEVQRTLQRNYTKELRDVQIVPPIPEGWSLEDNYAGAKSDPKYNFEVLQELEEKGEGNSYVAEELRAQSYWHQYAGNLSLKGLW